MSGKVMWLLTSEPKRQRVKQYSLTDYLLQCYCDQDCQLPQGTLSGFSGSWCYGHI